MLINDVRKIAKEHGIKTARLKKEDIIKLIQSEEGNYSCFGTAENGVCDQTGCLWMEDCLPLSKKKSS